MSFGPSAKTPPRHLGPAPRRGWAADAAEPQIRTSTGDDMSPPASPITGGWFRSRLSGDGSPPKTPETRPESPFSLGGLAARAGDALRADNEALFRQGLFNAVGNAILLLLVGLLYAVSSLLSQYRAPILWAVLVSLALRDVEVATVGSGCHHARADNLLPNLSLPPPPRNAPGCVGWANYQAGAHTDTLGMANRLVTQSTTRVARVNYTCLPTRPTVADTFVSASSAPGI